MLAKAFGASRIFTTVSSEEQQKVSLALGADQAINYRQEDFVEVMMQASDGKGVDVDVDVDVIVDIIAGDYVARNFAAAATYGRIVQIGVHKGAARELSLFPLLSKRLTLVGSTLRSRSHDEKAEIVAELERQVWR
ncbi:oxidoreductase [Pseudomonas chlororaphis]|uniref:zinc-binding dehydrogenase n=1 Tax=Pseudomonas chlororaphis TaxID=587753 RepID=UPI0004AC08EE|nr:zinc-binding dehydrogenase [Pseudomonas chlororaphis]AIC18011.1 oxidoreductase [Pseudomonas chlororaphis]